MNTRDPRTHPKPGDTYTDATGVTKALTVPDATGRVQVRFPDGRTIWTEEWGFWSEGAYERRNPKYDPQVGDTKTYRHTDGYACRYVVIGTDPLRYTFVGDVDAPAYGALEWPVEANGRGWHVVYACGDGS